MAYSFVTYTGNGSTTQFAVPFGYIRREHLQVSLNGTVTTAFTWLNDSTVQLNTAPANGVVVKLLRITPVDSSLVDFADGSTPVARDFDTANTQNLYTNQELRDISDATDDLSAQALSTANTALTNSTTAISTANGAVTTANTASSSAASAVTTANTANANAAAAVSTANAASTTAGNAVSTANAASTAATNAVNAAAGATTTANNAANTAAGAVTTANAAQSSAASAVSTANSASASAASAVTTAGNAVTTANNAVTTANSAVTTANSATATANTANNKADQALTAVANAILYDLVANVAAIPASPANNDAVEVFDSTGIESFTPLANKPAGFVGSSGLSVRMVYTTTGNTWNWIQYFPNDPETRYLKFSGGTLTGQLRGDDSASASTPGFAFDGDPDTGIGRLGANELGVITGGVVRLSFDAAGNAAFTGPVTIASLFRVNDAARLYDADASNYVGLKAPAVVSSDITFTLPAADGINGQALLTNGSGQMFWGVPAAAQTTLTIFEFVATNGQTTFSGTDANGVTLAYAAGSLIVSLNGAVLRPGNDYTASNGTSIVLTSAAAASDELQVVAFGIFNVANTYTKAESDGLYAKANSAQTWTAIQQFNAAIGLNGANYGAAGQVITSQGPGSPPAWQTPAPSGVSLGLAIALG